MSERPWMPHYINDFMLDTVGLELDEVGVYITMICLAWRRGDGSVSGDMKELTDSPSIVSFRSFSPDTLRRERTADFTKSESRKS